VGSDSAPALADLDADGDFDLVAGIYLGTFRYFENTGGAANPAFAPRTGTANPLAGQDVGFYSTPTFGDLDGDGDLDLVSGEGSSGIRYFANTGSAAHPAFAARAGAANPLDGQDVGFLATPALGDLDGDGDLDLVAGEYYGTLRAFENTGSRSNPSFVARTAAGIPSTAWNLGTDLAPAYSDLDGDGDGDLVVARKPRAGHSDDLV
jgi:hypothetical protein